MKPTIEIPELEMHAGASSNVAHTNPRGYTDITVDGVRRGWVIWEPGMQFTVEWGEYPKETVYGLGWRKSRHTARRAAIRLVKSILNGKTPTLKLPFAHTE